MKNKDKSKGRCGFCVLVGRPNVGKSTFLNSIFGKKLSIISQVPQTTRFSIRAIYNDERGQIVFIDTPGIYLSNKHLVKFLSSRSFSAKDEADMVIYMVDISRSPGKEEQEVLESLRDFKGPVIMLLNKRDLGQQYADDYIGLWKQTVEDKNDKLKYFIPISSLEKKGLDDALSAIFENLPQSPPLYPPDIESDLPDKLFISDIIREKIFAHMKKEVPHSVAVKVDAIEERKNNVLFIQATIIVERGSQKAIVIGKRGNMLKEVGREARTELEKIFEKRIFLDLWVKVHKNWQKDIHTLKELGYIT
jgi:GTP-binding protein Era